MMVILLNMMRIILTDQWLSQIDISFLPEDMKISYHEMIRERVERIFPDLI
jgi:hypothetical protein